MARRLDERASEKKRQKQEKVPDFEIVVNPDRLAPDFENVVPSRSAPGV